MKTGKVRKKIQLNNNDEAPRGAAHNIREQNRKTVEGRKVTKTFSPYIYVSF